MREIDFDLINFFFPKDFILDVKECYDEYFRTNKHISNRKYFGELGSYVDRNDERIGKDISDYFERLLFYPNIAILDYVVKNYDSMKNLKFVDNGAGLGLLSIFLKYVGVECDNYDNYSQISQVTFHRLIKEKLNLEVNPVVNTLNGDWDVLTSSGVWVSNPYFYHTTLKFMLVDPFFANKGIGNNLIPHHNLNLIGDYDKTLLIYGKK